jgi:hypothetical protein
MSRSQHRHRRAYDPLEPAAAIARTSDDRHPENDCEQQARGCARIEVLVELTTRLPDFDRRLECALHPVEYTAHDRDRGIVGSELRGGVDRKATTPAQLGIFGGREALECRLDPRAHKAGTVEHLEQPRYPLVAIPPQRAFEQRVLAGERASDLDLTDGPVDHQIRARHVGALIGRQEECRVRDLLGSPKPTERDHALVHLRQIRTTQ